MVSTTFENLNKDKKQNITKALLNEFSHHPLSGSKVSRIVAESGIARGAFYKYFDDLNDAYMYVYGQAMTGIHSDFKREPGISYSPEKYRDELKSFVDQASNSEYFDLIKMHITTNEALIEHNKISKDEDIMFKAHLDAKTWAIAVLTHETIKLILLHPESKKELLDRFYQAVCDLSIKEKE
ncbi:TetR/AcrR family transcriptional regulator [Companilactobacillus mishanensis]|uniref:TetR/AcrR family transcriptional regulator n=1 Tax=Companilactobacillus mishanensis TaxID=2486008 RepID=UPI0012968CE5|nr:TetR/AcrR family transcriptional regulator [Companilactobacillus mishanensis]MQS88894.1 TetR/AcrR family transcriptional regulator [Companilactobacillus mishanensis]